MLVKNNNNGRAQRFVILLLASMCNGPGKDVRKRRRMKSKKGGVFTKMV